MPSALPSLLHHRPARLFAGALGPVTGLQTRPSKLNVEALACCHLPNSIGVTPNTPTTGRKSWVGGTWANWPLGFDLWLRLNPCLPSCTPRPQVLAASLLWATHKAGVVLCIQGGGADVYS